MKTFLKCCQVAKMRTAGKYNLRRFVYHGLKYYGHATFEDVCKVPQFAHTRK